METEIEVRFLEIDKTKLVAKLRELGAEDNGEKLLEEVIFYDAAMLWPDEGRRVRIRKSGDTIKLDYKQNVAQTAESAKEVEFVVSDKAKATAFLENIGLVAHRYQEKYRHTFVLNNVTIDIDTWPQIPPYAELEGASVADLKKVASQLGFAWGTAVNDDPRQVMKQQYGIPLDALRWFTFSRIE